MLRLVAKEGEGCTRGYDIYRIMGDLIEEGKDAKLVDKSGRYLVNWDRALERYADYKRKKNPDFNITVGSRRTLSKGLRSALLSDSYKEDGADEYIESRKCNDRLEVVERQFQMPRKVFKFLFGNAELSDSSDEQDEQERGRHLSKGAVEAQASAESSSDTGFEESMDLPFEPSEPIDLASAGSFLTNSSLYDSANFEGPSTPFSDYCGFETQMSEQVTGLKEICSSFQIMPEVPTICPSSGPVKGRYPFNISLPKPLPDDVVSGMAEFEGVEMVELTKINPYTFSGLVPVSTKLGVVGVKVTSQCGESLGRPEFHYVDDMEEMAIEIVSDRAKAARFFAILSQAHGVIGTNSHSAQVLHPLNLESQGDFDSSIQAKQKQAVKFLELLVYTAAETGAKQFIEMIFSTSAQRIVFDSYKDRTPLPEDVARANGHCNLAQYFQDVTMRLTKEVDDQPKAIDWLELLKAVQNQVSVSQDKESKEETTPVESDGTLSDYFADDETSSCGSFEHDDEFTSNPEGKDTAEKDSPTGVNKERLLEDPPYSSIPDANHIEDSKPPDEKQSGSFFPRFFLLGDSYSRLLLERSLLEDLNFNRVLSSIKKTPLIGWIDNSPGFSFGICLSIAEMKAIARKVCGRCCSIVEMKEIAREIFGTVHITVGNSAQFLGGSPSKWINCRELSRYESKQEKRVLMAENVVVSASTCRLKRPGYLVLSPLEADERQLNQEQVIFERSIGDEPVQLPVTLLPNCSVLNKSRPQPDNSASLHDLSSGNVSWKNESNIKELKMERVRSWLCCNPNSEEFPSAEGDGRVVSLVAAIQDKESKEETTPAESDDNSSDYFAIINAETSSCGSFEHDDEFTSNPEGKDTAEKGGTSSKRTKCRSVSGIKEERKRLLMTENAVISESSCRLKRPGCSRLPKVHERHLNQELGIFEKSIGDESIHSPSTLSPSCSVFNKSQPQPDTSSSLHDLSSGNVSWEKESKIKELKMARVRSWLSCNRNSEEFPSAEGFES